MKNIVLGRYIPGNSFLYRLDPRVKLIALVLLFAATFIISDIWVIVGALGFVIALLPVGKISLKRVFQGLKPLLFLLIFTFVFQILFNTQGRLLIAIPLQFNIVNSLLALALFGSWLWLKRKIKFTFLSFLLVLGLMGYGFSELTMFVPYNTSTLAIYETGLTMALFILLRLIIIVTLSTVLTISTKPTDLNLGLERVLKPLKLVRVNTEEIAMIIGIALRYIPTLLDEANKIMLAQASRGVDFQEGKFKDKVVQIISLLVPMFIISFQRSDELANAMEARCFVPGKPRTRLNQLTWKPMDSLVLGVSIMSVITSITLRLLAL
jgi:energy-coupling factor transport system permease protein